MLSSFEYDPELRLVRVGFETELLPEDYAAAMERLTSASDYPPNVNVIWDLRAVRFFDIDMTRLDGLKAARARFADKRAGSVSAVIVPGRVEGTLIRLFDEMTHADGIKMTVVETEAAALAWCTGQAG